MLQAINLGIRRGVKLLFKDTSFQIHPGQKVGLTGANGTGKSSLFSLILKQLHADTGDCIYPDHWVIAHVAQELADSKQQAIEFVLDGDAELRQIQQAIKTAEKNDDGVLIATLHTQLDNIDGYTANSRASQLLAGLGFVADDESRAFNEFSGGWQMRLNLAKALMCRSDLLLLDEPTNHLDLDTIIWLESWLTAYRGTLLLISHDRDFLNNICSHIAHLEHQTIQLYTGNYSAFERIRAERLANQQSEYVKQQRNIKHIESYIERFRAKATKAKQAQSRLKALERMQTIAPTGAHANHRPCTR
jgi:ATP-binding cassette subfamily F protein 3